MRHTCKCMSKHSEIRGDSAELGLIVPEVSPTRSSRRRRNCRRSSERKTQPSSNGGPAAKTAERLASAPQPLLTSSSAEQKHKLAAHSETLRLLFCDSSCSNRSLPPCITNSCSGPAVLSQRSRVKEADGKSQDQVVLLL